MCTTIFPFPSSRLRALSPSPPHPIHQTQPSPNLKISLPFLLPTRAATDKGANSVSTFNDEKKVLETGKKIPEVTGSLGPSGLEGVVKMATKFDDSRWVNGTWDLKRFQKNNTTDWDAVIDAEVRRRKWFEDNPESSRVEDHVVFNTSVVPWWAWVKRFHLPEAERLNGRAAMLGFFMAYLVDSLTGIGLVDQTNNFVCKTLLFIVVLGVLLIRNNDDVENLKKFLQETTSYDKQWQATWKDKTPSSSNNE